MLRTAEKPVSSVITRSRHYRVPQVCSIYQSWSVCSYSTTINWTHATKVFPHGLGKVYIGPVEFDESTQVDSVQICVPLMADGEAIGVLVVGVKLTYLQARYLKPAQ